MEQLNELIEIAQQLDSVMDDEGSVLSLDISASRGVIFLVETKYMLRKFDSMDVIRTEKTDFPFKLETEIEGVRFRAHVFEDEAELLRGYAPDAWINEVNNRTEKVYKMKAKHLCKEVTFKHKKSPLALPCEDGLMEQTFYPHYV